MTVWDEVVGQPDAVVALKRAVAAAEDAVAGRGTGPAHAWLVTGPPGSGRSIAARAFAAALQCEHSGCGECHACTTVLKGTHADVQVVATEMLHIKVDLVRELVQIAQRHPSQGRWRVILVEDADRMLDEAGNALLKSIEEPPPRTIWVLCAPSPEDVLVTIRSRCRSLRLRLPSVQDVADLLVRRDGVDPAMAAFAARAAQSHVGMARRLARDETVRNRRHEVVSIPFEVRGVTEAVLQAGALVDIAGEEATAATAERDTAERNALLHSLGADGAGTLPRDVRAQVKQLENDQKRRATRYRRDVLDRSLLDLLSVYRDVLILQLGADVDLVNAPMRAQLVKLADSGTAEQTLRRMDAVGQARERIGLNVNPLLAVEAMALQLLSSA